MKYLFPAAMLSLAGLAQATTVTTLPFGSVGGPNSPEWTVILFGGTVMNSSPGQVELVTAPGQGIWFGNGQGYGDAANWSLGNNTQGNYLSLTASFSSQSADWSAYLHDGSYMAAFSFNPTRCAHACYDQPVFAGVEVSYAGVGGTPQTLFTALDLTQTHTFEWLLKGGLVSYRIDGNVVYSGAAIQAGGNILVIGDGSGSTTTGKGAMTLHGVMTDNAPTANVLEPLLPVPEPESWGLALAGLVTLGFLGRRRMR